MKSKIKNKLGNYYLDQKHNVVIISIMSGLSLCCLLETVPWIKNVLDGYSLSIDLIAVVFSAITYLIGRVWGKEENEQSDEKIYSNREKDKIDPFDIEREQYFEKLKGFQGQLFVLGDSGAGKSYMLGKLDKELREKSGCSSVLINNNYFEYENKIKGADYIILDQFEKILNESEPAKDINEIKDMDTKTVILSLRKEYFADVYKMFNRKMDYLWLEYDAHEKSANNITTV